MNKTFRLVFIGLLVAQSLALYIFEGMFPVPFLTPGAKLGLANLITVIALYLLPSTKDVFLILFLRVLLSTFFGGGPAVFIYSAAGAAMSFTCMVLLKKIGKNNISILGVSAAGAIFHHIGQLIAAACILQNAALMLYLPVLSLTGTITGILIGIAAHFIVRRLASLHFFTANFTSPSAQNNKISPQKSKAL